MRCSLVSCAFAIAFAAVAIAFAAVAGCADPEPPTGTAVAAATTPADLDLLFVVDNSGSMAGKQSLLANDFPSLVGALQQLEGGLPNVHLGIVSSNVGAAGQPSVPGCAGQGDDGNLLVKAGCTRLTGQFISDVADGQGNRVKNYTGSLDTLFSCMAQLGTSGCGFEMHLESMYRSLQPGKNPGFYRGGGAYLAVIILADEDDCSTEMGALFGDPTAALDSPLGPRTSFRCFEFGVVCDNDPMPRTFGSKTGCRPQTDSQYMYEVEKYVGFLHDLKADSSRVIVAAITGTDDAVHTVVVGPDPFTPTNPTVQKSCFVADPSDPTDGATPPIRIAAFLRRFTDRNTLQTICTTSLEDTLRTIGELIANAIEHPGPIVDAGVDAPAGPDAGTDGGNGGNGDGGGCCDTGAPMRSSLLAALPALALLRRRRRSRS